MVGSCSYISESMASINWSFVGVAAEGAAGLSATLPRAFFTVPLSPSGDRLSVDASPLPSLAYCPIEMM